MSLVLPDLARRSGGSTTYYTLDGSKPSKTNGFKYTKPFSVSGDTTIRFKTYKDGYKASKVYRYQYKNLNGSDSSLVAVETVINPGEAEFKSYVNALTLNPKKVNYKYVDNEIETIFSQITTSKMTTYEKMVACYDWCVKNIATGSAVTYKIDEDWSNYHSYNTYYAMLNMKYALKNRKGTCDNFSALYYAMLRRIGIEEAAWYEGTCATSGGGTTGHKWTGICMADNHCIMYFDPMLEYGKMNRQYFARNYESTTKLYNAKGYYDNNSFGDF
ncbi:MAG: chitobiase/beta-hexosaminidase C-terminal domain-containing protein [Eubacterium sp.]|nr:chitobiase/beta-hexosaminidase C-terminal domain-containing protein [Eubacterium sp.]MCM1439933.1 chitobiase/beta-hexosaminidase C-terminal domain-containing protein [Roseburia sp.]